MKPLPLRQLLGVMLLLDVLGLVAFMGHASGGLSILMFLAGLIYGLPMLLPTALLGGLSALLYRRSPFAAVGAGLLSALAAAWYGYILGDPQYNQDANIGMGMYMLLGALWPLGPVWLFGGVVGQVVSWLTEWQGRERSSRLKV